MYTSQFAALSPSVISVLRCQRFRISALLLELLIAVALVQQMHLVSAGSCSEAQLCCNGRDSSCVVQKSPTNAIIEDLNDKPCYCDHACMKLGDCCIDFKDHCGVVDCEVDDWTPWSECNESCGAGIMTRTRKIMKAPQNGGKHCPFIIQKKSCQGFRCHGEREKHMLRETALLLPSLQIQIHGSNKSKEILWHGHNTKRHGSNEYCIEFEVIKVARECHKFSPYHSLIEGDRIAVGCNLHGNLIKSNLLKRSLNTKNSIIKVDNSHFKDNRLEFGKRFDAEDYSETKPTGSDEHTKRGITSATFLHPSTHVKGKKLKSVGHCRGEGVPGRITRWRALAVPSCRGKWLRLTLGTPERCPHSQFEFV